MAARFAVSRGGCKICYNENVTSHYEVIKGAIILTLSGLVFHWTRAFLGELTGVDYVRAGFALSQHSRDRTN